jgi:hypothetical protein
MKHSEELVAGYLEGDLRPEELAELASLIQRNSDLRKCFLDLAGVEGLLRAEFASGKLQEELLRRVPLCLVRPEEEEEKTTERIMAWVEAVSTQCAGDVVRADQARRTTRRSRLQAQPEEKKGRGVLYRKATLIAAGFLVSLSLVLLYTLSGQGAPKVGRADAPTQEAVQTGEEKWVDRLR